MSRRAGRTSGTVAGLLVVVLAAGACTDDGGSDAGPQETPSQTPTTPAVATQVSFGELTGKVSRQVRRQLSGEVGDVVDGWIDAAYVAGDYPRRDFSDSWPGFTAGARADAQRDRALMSNQDIGATVEGVEATRRRVRIDVLTVRKRPVGVTAHVAVVLATTGKPTQRIRVAGRLFLTPTDQGWRVFGYDITKGAAR